MYTFTRCTRKTCRLKGQAVEGLRYVEGSVIIFHNILESILTNSLGFKMFEFLQLNNDLKQEGQEGPGWLT